MSPLVGPAPSPGIHVMTWNVRRRMGGPTTRNVDDWRRRRDAVAEAVSAEAPTILCVQEALPDQAEFIGSALGGRYRRVGHGRRPGPRGEGCPLYFDAERLELTRFAQTALSTRPDEAGSRSWGVLFPRVLVRARFRDRATSLGFTVFNTHLDPFSAWSRMRSAELIRGAVIAAHSPAIVAGDLNADPTSRTVRELLADGAMRDAWTEAATRLSPEWRSYTGYRPPRPAKHGRGRIDAILVTPGILIERAAISLPRHDGIWPSDHVPLHAVLRLPSSGATS